MIESEYQQNQKGGKYDEIMYEQKQCLILGREQGIMKS